jgi:predicted dehydrogenase
MIPALKDSDLAMIAAVASRDKQKAAILAKELGIPKFYGDYQKLLDDSEIDAVYIPLPNHLHKKWSIRAADSGKHILCEKPLALDPEECQEMIAAADANQVILMESFMYRYHPRIIAAADMIRGGEIGTLRTIDSGFTFFLSNQDDIRLKFEEGGGAVMDVGCYCINISRLMAGREPVAVQAKAIWASTGVDEQLVGLLDFDDGLYAHFDCAFNQAKRQQCILAGSKGYFMLPETFNPGEKRTVIQAVHDGETTVVHTYDGANPYQLIAEDCMRAIAGEEPLYPLSDSISNMRVIQALLESAKANGKVIYL